MPFAMARPLVRFLILSALTGVLVLSPVAARAQGVPLTRARIVELARAAPAMRVAQSEAGVARAVASVAGALSLDNPVLQGLGGVRWNPDGGRPFSAQAQLSWPVDLGGR